MPQIRFLNLGDFRPVFELDEYDSLVYTRRWQDLDDFELTFSGDSTQGKQLLAKGIIPSRNTYLISVSIEIDSTPTRDFVGIIDVCDAMLDSNAHTWSIKGYGVDRILSDRIILPPQGSSHDSYSGAAETIMKSLVNRHCINPITTGIPGIEDAKRDIPALSIDTDTGAGSTYSFEGRFQRLLDALAEIARGGGDLGFSVDLEEPSLIFKIATGQDKTGSVVFSLGLDNVQRFEFFEDGLEASNCAIIAGQGDEELRSVIARGATGNSPVGMERRELFIDARDLSSIQALENRADSQLQEKNITRSYTASIRSGARPMYRADWDLGDIVTVRNNAWGIEQEVRIFEIEAMMAPNQDVLIVPQFARQRIEIKDKIAELVSATGRN